MVCGGGGGGGRVYKFVTFVLTSGQKPGRMLGVYHFPFCSLETVSL